MREIGPTAIENIFTRLPNRALDHIRLLSADTISELGEARVSGAVATVEILLAWTFRGISVFNLTERGLRLE